MKKNLLGLGVLLLFLMVIVLANIFWQDQKPKDKKSIEDSQLESLTKKKKDKTLSVMSESTEDMLLNKKVISEDDQLKATLHTHRTQENESKRVVAIERRKSRVAERKRYETARREWRRSLNKARKEAKLSGDYSEYETIKREEPGKSKYD